MSVKVQPVALGLCGTCSASHVFVEGDRQRMICGATYGAPLELRSLVSSCNSYYEKGRTSKNDFEEIATIIRVDKSGRFIGFKGPKKED